MSLSALGLAAALLTAQPIAPPTTAPRPLANQSPTSDATSVGELHLRSPRAHRAPRAARPPISWSYTPSKARGVPLPARGFVIYPLAENCRSGLSVARGPAAEKMQPLSKMPSGHLELAVARLVDGCPVAVPMRADDKIR